VTFQRKLLLGFSLMSLPALLIAGEALRTNALERRAPVRIELPIRNINRTVGAMLSGEIARRYREWVDIFEKARAS